MEGTWIEVTANKPKFNRGIICRGMVGQIVRPEWVNPDMLDRVLVLFQNPVLPLSGVTTVQTVVALGDFRVLSAAEAALYMLGN